MVIALIRPAIAVATQVYKHRKTIYAVLTAQDRYISKSFRYGGYGKATSYGVRSGALVGGIVGAFINAPDTPGNDGSIPFKKQPKTSPPDKTRGRRTGRYSSKYNRFQRGYKSSRCPRPRKY